MLYIFLHAISAFNCPFGSVQEGVCQFTIISSKFAFCTNTGRDLMEKKLDEFFHPGTHFINCEICLDYPYPAIDIISNSTRTYNTCIPVKSCDSPDGKTIT